MDRKTKIIRRLYLVAIGLGIAAILGLTVGLRALTHVFPGMVAIPLIWLLLPVGFVVLACIVSLPFADAAWRRTDEAAREAQKTAWYWGGSFGALFGLLSLVVANTRALREQFLAGAWRPGEIPHTDIIPMIDGALIVLLAQMAGALIVWAFWWRRHSSNNSHSQIN